VDLKENLFPLGRPYGEIDGSAELPSGLDTRPFGLSCARTPKQSVPLDLTTIGYDSDRQTGVVLDGGAWVSLAKHTTGETGTTTNPDGHRGPDSDNDQRED
jgi:putative ATP-grasp target RiPP